MTDTSAALAVLTGLAVRLMIPILITVLVVLVLTSLDKRWQTEATTTASQVQKPACWDLKHCSAEQRKTCVGFRSDAPCWQAFRLTNGYLDQKCLGCPVFSTAPALHRS
jgi:hypothetical protein